MKASRERWGWSQQELAGHAETSVGVVSTIERGKLEPGLGLASRIANALGVSLDSLRPDVPGVGRPLAEADACVDPKPASAA